MNKCNLFLAKLSKQLLYFCSESNITLIDVMIHHFNYVSLCLCLSGTITIGMV